MFCGTNVNNIPLNIFLLIYYYHKKYIMQESRHKNFTNNLKVFNQNVMIPFSKLCHAKVFSPVLKVRTISVWLCKCYVGNIKHFYSVLHS